MRGSALPPQHPNEWTGVLRVAPMAQLVLESRHVTRTHAYTYDCIYNIAHTHSLYTLSGGRTSSSFRAYIYRSVSESLSATGRAARPPLDGVRRGGGSPSLSSTPLALPLLADPEPPRGGLPLLLPAPPRLLCGTKSAASRSTALSSSRSSIACPRRCSMRRLNDLEPPAGTRHGDVTMRGA